MLTRRELMAGVTAAAMMPRAARARDRKPNLLYLLADDHAGYVLGADGNRMAVTPNLDRLASEGVRFARHYCNAPVCTPSRQSFFSSRMPHAAGVTLLGTPLANDSPTLARQMKATGYTTAVYGKMHFNQHGRAGLHGFDEVHTEDVAGREWKAAVGATPSFTGIRTKPAWHPFQDPASVWLNADKLPYPRSDEDMEGRWIARRAVEYMRAHQDEPFALWVSFMEPHSPFDFPVEDREAFRADSFRVPAAGPEDAGQIPLIFRGLTMGQKQGIAASYYTSVRFLDRNVGVVLDGLRKLGLEDDTLVVYMSDHGYSLGQHGRFEKHTCFEPNLRVPLIMRFPGRIRSGAVVEAMTESIDVPPTILSLLGGEPFAVNHGRSLEGYLTTVGRPAARPFIFSEYLENEEACLRTERWKYIHCSGRRARTDGYVTGDPTPGRTLHLFDLKSDPGEFRNLAAKHPEVVEELSREMLKVFRSTHPDAGDEPDRLARADAIEWYLRPRDGPV